MRPRFRRRDKGGKAKKLRPNPERMNELNPALQRLSHYAGGRPKEEAGALLFSSAPSPWAGFRLERHALYPGSGRGLCWPTIRVWLVRAGELQLRERADKDIEIGFHARQGSITIWPAGHESTSLDWTGTAELIDLEIAPGMLERFGAFDIRCAELAAQRGIEDPASGCAPARHGR